MYNSQKIGIILYISHILAALTVGLIFRFYKKGESVNSIHYSNKSTITKPFSNIFSDVMRESVISILLICGSVVFFKVIVDIIAFQFNLQGFILALVTGFLEFTSGVTTIASIDASISAKVILTSIILGFAGISVHFQVFNIISKTDLNSKAYFSGKILHSCFCALYTIILLKIAPFTAPAFMNSFPSPLELNPDPTSIFVFCTGYIVTGLLFIIIITTISSVSCLIENSRLITSKKDK